MARRRKKRALRPRMPARTKRKRTQKQRGRQHPELIGLGIVAFGLFMATVLYAAGTGGTSAAGSRTSTRSWSARWPSPCPILFVVVGGLMIARSTLLDLRPFRTGLFVLALGLLFVLGRAHGGYAGRGLESLFSKLDRETPG